MNPPVGTSRSERSIASYISGKSGKSGKSSAPGETDWDETLRFFFIDKEGCDPPSTSDDAGYDPKKFDCMKPFKADTDGEDIFAAAVAFGDTGEFYGFASTEGDAAELFERTDYIGDCINEDGITEEFEVDERESLLKTSMGNAHGGLWLCGEKYTVCKSEELAIKAELPSGMVQEAVIRFTLAMRYRQGVYIARSPAQIAVAMWKGDPDVNAGNCRWYLHHFMKAMLDQGICENEESLGSVDDASSSGGSASLDEDSDDWKGC